MVHKWVFYISEQTLEVGGEAVFFWWMNTRDTEKIKAYIEFMSYMSEWLHK